MDVIIREETFDSVAEYATISIAYEAATKVDLHLVDGTFSLEERQVTPFRKDYDALPENDPTWWSRHFDVSRWGILGAFYGGVRCGGAALAYGSPHVDMLEGRADLAVLWDLRVAKDLRGRGVGTLLWRAAEEWARKRGCTELKVETQHDNPAACLFYESRGCDLVAIDRQAYPEQPDEVQMIWYRTLE